MTFTEIGKTAGDDTTPYKITDYKAKTVGEFVEEVLTERPNEWGYISVNKHFYQSGNTSCEYADGLLKTELPKEVLDIEIKEIMACGGWSRMDYTINWH